MSVAVAVSGTAVPAVLSCSAVTSAGQVITGGIVSSTLTKTVSLALFPNAFVAVTVTVVPPSGNTAVGP